MSENLFFDKRDLKHCGENVIIGKTVRIRYPELVSIGDNAIIDDFTYISTAMELASYVHLAFNCSFIGGRNSLITFDSFSTTSSGVVMAAGSDDFKAGLATPIVPMEFKGDVHVGAIHIGKHCIIGANSSVLPDVTFAEGACVGANSMVKSDLQAWGLYAGAPAKLIKQRDAAAIQAHEANFLASLQANK